MTKIKHKIEKSIFIKKLEDLTKQIERVSKYL